MHQNLKIHTTFNGLKNLVLKDEVNDQIVSCVQSNKFDVITFKEGDWSDLRWLVDSGSKVKALTIDTDRFDWSVIPRIETLSSLKIGGWFDKCDIAFDQISGLKYLETYWNDGYDDRFFNIPSIEVLNVKGLKDEDLSRLGQLKTLKFVRLIDSRVLLTLEGIQDLKNLEFAEFIALTKLKNIDQISQCPKIRYLDFESCKKVLDFSPIGDIGGLNELLLSKCEVQSLSWVRGLEKLERVRVDCALKDGRLDFLYEMPNLKLALYRNSRNVSPKLKEIQKFLEGRGFDQFEERLKGASFPGFSGYLAGECNEEEIGAQV